MLYFTFSVKSFVQVIWVGSYVIRQMLYFSYIIYDSVLNFIPLGHPNQMCDFASLF